MTSSRHYCYLFNASNPLLVLPDVYVYVVMGYELGSATHTCYLSCPWVFRNAVYTKQYTNLEPDWERHV